MVRIILLLCLFSTSTFAKEFKQVKIAATKLSPAAKKIEQQAWWVYTYAQKYNIDPYIMLALIKVESNFDQAAVSETGDYSLAQINYAVWNKELESKGMKLDYEKLQKNSSYAIEKMAIILSLIKKRHAKKDPHWYGRYHSNTKKYKKRYLKKVNHYLSKINAPNSRSIAQDN